MISIVQNYRRGLSIEELMHEFTHLRPAEIYDALSYYDDHRTEIDQEIAALTDVEQMMQQYPPTLIFEPCSDC